MSCRGVQVALARVAAIRVGALEAEDLMSETPKSTPDQKRYAESSEPHASTRKADDIVHESPWQSNVARQFEKQL